MWIIAPLFCGLIFGAGLLISGMVQPTKVLGFLDIFGAWDPSLAVVMAAALAVSVPGFRLADRVPAIIGRAIFPADQNGDRSAAGAGGGAVRKAGALSGYARGRRWRASRRCRPGSSSSSSRWLQAWCFRWPRKNRGRQRGMIVPGARNRWLKSGSA